MYGPDAVVCSIMAGVSMSEPKQPRSEKPTSSSTMTTTLGVSSGGVGCSGHHGVDSS
ncbi:hypothetical protein [Streptomyces violaceusniger]|uniref:hypothetical protein n=1 Tax=Streptomyces violaceusniger TaxID=68280 RepID=UPI003692550F